MGRKLHTHHFSVLRSSHWASNHCYYHYKLALSLSFTFISYLFGLISSSDLPRLALPFCGLAPSIICNPMIIKATVSLLDVKPPKLFEFFNNKKCCRLTKENVWRVADAAENFWSWVILTLRLNGQCQENKCFFGRSVVQSFCLGPFN